MSRVKCEECERDFFGQVDQGKLFICSWCMTMGHGFDPQKYAQHNRPKTERELKLEHLLLLAVSYWSAHIKGYKSNQLIAAPYFALKGTETEKQDLVSCLDALEGK